MIEWWPTLSLSMKILWAVTLSASLIFVIQTVLTFIGVGGDINTDFEINTDFDAGGDAGAYHDMGSGHTGMGLLTFRNFINFILGFGWTAILLRSEIASKAVLLFVSLLAGLLLVAIVVLLFKWITGMQQSGNIDVFKSAVGCVGKVYIPVPAERSGEGKVQITINNSVREYNAITDGEALPTGRDIKVVEVISESTLLVEEIMSLII